MTRLFPPIPNADHVASAFRETNTDKDKDLDNSVLWRAMSGLRSAVDALKADVSAWHADQFKGMAFDSPFSAHNFYDEFDRACAMASNFLDVIHPVVLIDSGMWIMDARGRLQGIDSCRFVQVRANGTADWWCDVIKSSSGPGRLADISDHYSRFLRMRKMRLV